MTSEMGHGHDRNNVVAAKRALECATLFKMSSGRTVYDAFSTVAQTGAVCLPSRLLTREYGCFFSLFDTAIIRRITYIVFKARLIRGSSVDVSLPLG